MQLEAGAVDLRPVLVVEDSDDDFDTVVVAAARAKVGNRLVRASDAERAWQLLARDPVGSFAFILLDYDLQGPDGLAFLGQVRRNGLWAQLPVVVLTTSVNPRDRDVFCAAGANAFHVKSVQYTDCLCAIESIFGRWLNPSTLTKDAAMPSPARGLA